MQFPIRQDIKILPADVVYIGANDRMRINSNGKTYRKIPGQLRFTIKEKIGVAIVNPRGVVKSKKSVIVGE